MPFVPYLQEKAVKLKTVVHKEGGAFLKVNGKRPIFRRRWAFVINLKARDVLL